MPASLPCLFLVVGSWILNRKVTWGSSTRQQQLLLCRRASRQSAHQVLVGCLRRVEGELESFCAIPEASCPRFQVSQGRACTSCARTVRTRPVRRMVASALCPQFQHTASTCMACPSTAHPLVAGVVHLAASVPHSTGLDSGLEVLQEVILHACRPRPSAKHGGQRNKRMHESCRLAAAQKVHNCWTLVTR